MAARILFLGLVILIAMSIPTQATILNSDGDFGAQTLDMAVGSPWAPVGPDTIVSSAAQSPNTNVYADNGKGAIMPASDSFIVNTFSPQTAATTPMLYYNVDFCMNEVGAIQRFDLGRDAGQSDAVTFFANDTSFFISNGGTYGGWDGASLDLVTNDLTLGTWYNVQLAVDLVAKTCSGRISTPTASIGISTKSLIEDWDGTINGIFTDGVGPGQGAYYVDNFAVSTDPLTSIGPDPVFPPEIIYTTINIDFNGTRDSDPDPITYQPANGDVYNGILLDSRGGTVADDNLSISASNLLDSHGNATTVGFAVSPVAGDQFPAYIHPEDPSLGEALTSDYLFVQSVGNESNAPFTISGLGDVETVNIVFNTGYNPQDIFIDGAVNTGGSFLDVPVVNGEVSGIIGNGAVVTVYSMTILIPMSEEDYIPGDANHDGAVNSADAAVLAAHWQTAGGANWEQGDFNGDGAVNDIDATILAANWMTASPASVPEPSVLAMLLACLAALAWRKRG